MCAVMAAAAVCVMPPITLASLQPVRSRAALSDLAALPSSAPLPPLEMQRFPALLPELPASDGGRGGGLWAWFAFAGAVLLLSGSWLYFRTDSPKPPLSPMSLPRPPAADDATPRPPSILPPSPSPPPPPPPPRPQVSHELLADVGLVDGSSGCGPGVARDVTEHADSLFVAMCNEPANANRVVWMSTRYRTVTSVGSMPP